MKWAEFTVHTTSFGSELVGNLFFELGCAGIVVSDKAEVLKFLESKKNWDYYDDDIIKNLSEVVMVKGFCEESQHQAVQKMLNERLNELKNNEVAGFEVGSLEVLVKYIDEEDWVNVWKKYYQPLIIKNVVICPEWIDFGDTDKTVVKIEPGMAFGTGSHETTSMCIDLMQDFELSNKDVLDVGCGSGILGATALKLCAKSAFLVDFDNVAVDAARLNLKLNKIDDKAIVECGDLLEKSNSTYDVVFANITADVLIRLVKDLGRFVKEGSVVIISGLIHTRVDEVVEIYKNSGYKLVKQVKNGEWNAASFIFQN